MKVVLFCGGLGTRMKEYSETLPKPMVDIGYRPMIWHLMKYYAHYGHKEFILCLGYRGDIIKNYFLHYDECLSNDFVMTQGGRAIETYNNDIADWKISFIDTGLHTNVGQRLCAVRKYLADDEIFMANYTDGLTDLCLPRYLDYFMQANRLASFVAVKPSQSFHTVTLDADGQVNKLEAINAGNIWINGGFFILRNTIFDYIHFGDELVGAPFERLIEARQLIGYKHAGFWACMDTFKEKKSFDDMYARGETPWMVWNTGRR